MRRLALATVAVLTFGAATGARAQFSSHYDSVTTWSRVGRNVAYGVAMGFVYSGWDQIRNDPTVWRRTWNGYGKRVASNTGEFVIQEMVSDGLSFALRRPQGYKPCNCGNNTGQRITHAFVDVVVDEMPDGSRRFAWPRWIGAFAGSTAQASWRPHSGSRANILVSNAVSSLVIGGLINTFYEFKK
jgi:hypothetical protein